MSAPDPASQPDFTPGEAAALKAALQSRHFIPEALQQRLSQERAALVSPAVTPQKIVAFPGTRWLRPLPAVAAAFVIGLPAWQFSQRAPDMLVTLSPGGGILTGGLDGDATRKENCATPYRDTRIGLENPTQA